MERYVAILRGINVGGHNKIKMADLREGLSSLGLEEVETYIQSGNVSFSSEKMEVSHLAGLISQHINDAYGYDIPVIVLDAERIARAVDENPFLIRKGIEPGKLHTVFFSGNINTDGLAAAQSVDFSPDEMKAGQSALYLHCPNGLARTKYTNAFFDKHLGTVTSMRNWKTTLKLLDMIRNK